MAPDVQVEPSKSCPPRAVPDAYLMPLGRSLGINDRLPTVATQPLVVSDLVAFAASLERSASTAASQHRPSRAESIRSSRRVRAKTTESFIWALAPLLTLGLATVPCFVFAARRLRSRALYLAVVAYSALTLLVVWGSTTDSETNFQSEVGGFTTMVLVTSATLHALIIRRCVFSESRGDDTPIAVARARLRRRHEARRIAAADPMLARELRIGRPDQPRAYDDGGLIDVNHVPLGVLSAVEGIGPELASSIVDARELIRRFDSREDLESVLGLDPYSLDSSSDLLMFMD